MACVSVRAMAAQLDAGGSEAKPRAQAAPVGGLGVKERIAQLQRKPEVRLVEPPTPRRRTVPQAEAPSQQLVGARPGFEGMLQLAKEQGRIAQEDPEEEAANDDAETEGGEDSDEDAELRAWAQVVADVVDCPSTMEACRKEFDHRQQQMEARITAEVTADLLARAKAEAEVRVEQAAQRAAECDDWAADAELDDEEELERTQAKEKELELLCTRARELCRKVDAQLAAASGRDELEACRRSMTVARDAEDSAAALLAEFRASVEQQARALQEHVDREVADAQEELADAELELTRLTEEASQAQASADAWAEEDSCSHSEGDPVPAEELS